MSTRKKTDAEKFLNKLTGEENISFGRMIKSLRLSDNLSQVELARRMGKSKQYINDVESDRTVVSAPMAAMFAMVMGYSLPMFVSKALKEQLSKNGLPLEVHLTALDKNFELEVMKEFLSEAYFRNSPKDFVLGLLEDKKTPHAQAKKLVNKYILNDEEENKASV